MSEPFLVGSIDWMDNTAMKNHTLGHSVADLIDNSIDANSDQVDVVLEIEDFPVSTEANKHVLSFYIIDDGDGIALDRLKKVLTVERRRDSEGNEAYHETHLGAFGLGVPTSTLSQGSHITLLSKTGPEQPVNFSSISRIDRFRFNRAEVLSENDLRTDYPDLLQTTLFVKAYEELSSCDKGTVILVQYLHRNCYAADNLQELTDIKDEAVKRLKAYLGLVFEHYINGVDLIDHQGEVHHKEINLQVLGIDVDPLDPLMQNMIDESREGVTGTHINQGTNFAPVSGRQREFHVSVAVVPGAEQQGGIRPVTHDDQMKYALAMRREGSGDEGAPITDCQGLYLYRNMRLIEFGTWKGINTGGANYTCARAAVYGPVGFNISDQSMLYTGRGANEGFSCDPSKITVNMSPLIVRRVKAIIDDEHQWHQLDDRRTKGYTRANGRIAYDRRMQRPAPPPRPRTPSVTMNMDPPSGPPPLQVEFSAVNTGNVNADEFIWVIEGNQLEGQELTYTFENVGVYPITLQGSRGDLQSTPVRGQITVQENQPPIPPPPTEPQDATLSEFNNPDEDVIKFEVDINGRITLLVNRGSEYFSSFATEFSDRFGE